MAGHTAASSVATGGANPETGGASGMAGNTGAAGAAAGASSAGEIASAGATDLAGAMAGTTGSGGKSAGGTSAGGKTGSAGATGSSGGVIGSGGATNLAGATASGGVMGSGGAAGKTTGGSAAAGNTGSAGATATGGSKPAGGTTTNGGTKATGGTTATGGATATGGTTVVINPGQCDATTTPVARHGKLRIENGKLVNQCGRPIQLASMSMYDWSQQGRQFYNADAVKNLAGTGTGQKSCPSLRVPLLASNYPSQYARMKTVMDACIANGIYCIPNWHVIGNAVVANAKAFYVQLANDYGNTPNIIYEPWNEPTTATWPTIKAYMEEIIAAVRPIDPDNIFLSGTRQWDQRPDEACANPITSTTNVGYVFHFYANSHTLAGFQGNLTKCLNANQLIWATEYGGVSSSGNGTFNVTEVNKWWDYLDQNLISSNNWAVETNGETSSVFVKTASATGPWDDSQITDSGKNVFPYIAKRYPILMSQ
jgi:endoglucanase